MMGIIVNHVHLSTPSGPDNGHTRSGHSVCIHRIMDLLINVQTTCFHLYRSCIVAF